MMLMLMLMRMRMRMMMMTTMTTTTTVTILYPPFVWICFFWQYGDRLVGQVVKASASREVDPGFIS